MKPLLLCLLGCLGSVLLPAWAAPQPLRQFEGVAEYRLANGLQVLLVPDASKPTTTVNMTYRVGSKHESYGETGMAHLLEHLLFKGSPRHRDVWAEFARRGLEANGTTWFDRTNYFASFSAKPETLKWYLGWQADAMVNSFIAQRDLDTEMTVVRNEMEMGENSPGSITWERLIATMYQWHNYGKSTIGARTDVENVDIGRLKAFYKLHYQPDNATLIVTGKFETATTLRWIESAFGKLPKSRTPRPRLYTLDPVQDGERRVTVRRSGGTPSATVGYHGPSAAHPDYPAAELLQIILAEPPAGRVHKRLVEELKLAASVSGFVPPLAEPGMVVMGADAAPGADAAALGDQLAAVVEGLATAPVSERELERARTRWLNRWDKMFDDPQQVGAALSEAVAAGDWRLLFLLRDRVRSIDLAAVNRVAAERLLPSNRTLALYIPTDKPQRAPRPEAVDLQAQLQGLRAAPPAPPVPAFDASPLAIDRATQRLNLPGGARAVLLAKPTRGQAVHGEIQLRFGTLDSLRGQRAVSDLLAALLDKGTAQLDRQALRDRLDALKLELSVGDGPSGVTLHFSSTCAHAADALRLLLSLLREPRLEPAALDEVRAQFLTALEAQRSEPEAIVSKRLGLLRSRYPGDDPRNERDWDRIVQELRAVTPEALRDFHRQHYGAAATSVALVGDFDADAVAAALQDGLAAWLAPLPPRRLPRPGLAVPPAVEFQRTPDKQNASFGATLSLPVNDSHADYAPLLLADYLLGGNTDSRLWMRIRERDGLSYGIGSGIDWNAFEPASVWSFSAIFAPQNRARVEAAFREELQRALKDGFQSAELAHAQRALLNYRALGRAQDGGLASGLATQAYLGRSMARSAEVDAAIAKASLADVNAALRRYLRPEQMQIVWAGDFPADKP